MFKRESQRPSNAISYFHHLCLFC